MSVSEISQPVPVQDTKNIFSAFSTDVNEYKAILPTAESIKERKQKIKEDLIKNAQKEQQKKLRWEELDGNTPNSLARTVVFTNISTKTGKNSIRAAINSIFERNEKLKKILADKTINKKGITIEKCIEAIYFRCIDLNQKGDEIEEENGIKENEEKIIENNNEEENNEVEEKEEIDEGIENENINNENINENETEFINENSANKKMSFEFDETGKMLIGKVKRAYNAAKRNAVRNKLMISTNPNATMNVFVRFVEIDSEVNVITDEQKAALSKEISKSIKESKRDEKIKPRDAFYKFCSKLVVSPFVEAVVKKSGLVLINGKHAFMYCAIHEHPQLDEKKSLFLGGLPQRFVNTEAVIAFFERRYGLHATQFRMPRDPQTQITKGFAIIQFAEEPPRELYEKQFAIEPESELKKYKMSKKNDEIGDIENALSQSKENEQRKKENQFTIRIKKCVSEKKAMKRKNAHDLTKKIIQKRERKLMTNKPRPKILEKIDKNAKKEERKVIKPLPKSSLRFVGRKISAN